MEKEPFDHRTTVRDKKTGKEIGKNDYKLEITKNKDGHTESKYERPIGSGVFFHPNGEKIVIQGDVHTHVAIDENGKTEEEFNKDHKDLEKASKGHAGKDK